ncbi:MAG: diguanylate cyclase [Candidatus Competibacteraceae bacterium]|nr:diguanylate cyclase [Candidatus Competibacteraceae bacterium]
MATSKKVSLVTRTTLWILAVIAFVGLVFLWWGNTLAIKREVARAQEQLRQLLDTVERSASIACFLQDQQLAKEVSQGLLSNKIVKRVVIRTGTTLLAEAARLPKAAGGVEETTIEHPADFMRRQLVSPFNPDEVVGEILLSPDSIELKSQAIQAAYFIGILLMVQILAVGITVVLVVYRLITQPIKLIADSLQVLPAEQGQTLAYPHRRHERDELGGLVNYINHMIARLVSLLNEERNLRQQREIEERKFRSIFENADTGIFLVDQQGKMLSYNPACRKLMRAVGRSETDPISRVTNFFNNDEMQVGDMIKACLREDKNVQQDIKLVGTDGGLRWVNITLSRIEDVVFQGVANDVTERKLAETAAQKAAVTDALTGIFNRLGFEINLQNRLNKICEKPEFWLALMLIDLDFFKQVNDTYGHDAGDRVLIHFARLLEGSVRKSDLIGRLGGDEFVLFVDYIDQPQRVEKIAKNIITNVAEPIDIGEGQTAQIGASIGIALFRGISVSQEQLFKQADEAMYQAKKKGRNTYCVYTQTH